VVDQLLLGLDPIAPADRADLLEGTESQVILEGPEGHLVPLLAAAGAG
jgi:hypothetical protein